MNTPAPPHHIRIALVEDDVHFQQALGAALASSPDMVLTHLARNRAQGLSILEQASADVLLVDLGLPDGSGIDVIHAAYARWPDCAIMVCTTFSDEANVLRSIEAGAAGYLLKDSEPAELLHEIRVLQQGGSPISPMIARQILTRFRRGPSATPGHAAHRSTPLAAPGLPRQEPEPTAPDEAPLSSRELEVLGLITKGFTTDEIAVLMAVSVHTVQTYVRRVYGKLKVRSRSQAIFEARHRGILPV